MPADEPDLRKNFILRQPFRLADDGEIARRWAMAMDEQEPTDDKSGSAPAFKPPPTIAAGRMVDPHWRRIERDTLLALAISEDHLWRRVGLVCGAGLGKTTNLKWLEAAINRLNNFCGKYLAFFLELRELPSKAGNLLEFVTEQIAGDDGGKAKDRVRWQVRRLRAQGRITLLLDSLDQAGPEPTGAVIKALEWLLFQSEWQGCRIWVSGRPYAFRSAEVFFTAHPNILWQFVRVGQLDEPECRFLLETENLIF